MTNEEKQLLTQDLSARLPYGVILDLDGVRGPLRGIHVLHKYNNTDSIQEIDAYIQFFGDEYIDIIHFKPYLRPMSSMTEEEKEEILNLLFGKEAKRFFIDKKGRIEGKPSDFFKEGLNYPRLSPINIVRYTNWLNAHHFDYRGLIPMGLALEAPEGMYNN